MAELSKKNLATLRRLERQHPDSLAGWFGEVHAACGDFFGNVPNVPNIERFFAKPSLLGVEKANLAVAGAVLVAAVSRGVQDPTPDLHNVAMCSLQHIDREAISGRTI